MYPGGGFHDFFVHQLLGQYPGGHVGDAGDSHHLQPAMGSHQGLRDRGHPHRVRPQDPGHTDLGRGLIAGPGNIMYTPSCKGIPASAAAFLTAVRSWAV